MITGKCLDNNYYYKYIFTGYFDRESKSLEAEFVSWPMVRYKREVLFGWVDLLGEYFNIYF